MTFDCLRTKAAVAAALILGASLSPTPAGAQAPPEDGFPEDQLPLPVLTSNLLERRVLRAVPGRPPAEARTRFDVTARIRNVQGAGWQGSLFGVVADADTGAVATVQSLHSALPEGESTLEAQFEIDGGQLGPGDYTVRAVVFAGLDEHTVEDVEQIPALFANGARPPAIFVASAEDGLEVLDEGAADVAAYQAAIASGNPDTVYKGLSALIGHYRARRQYPQAEAAVLAQQAAAGDAPALAALQPIFRLWNVDDRRLAGDSDGAVALLEELIAGTPEGVGFFGEPFRGRALLELGRLRSSIGDFAGSLAAYDQLIVDYPGLRPSTARMERAFVHLERGDYAAARGDYQEVIDRHRQCEDAGDDEPCASRGLAEEAERKIRVLDSDRSWFRASPEEIVAGLHQALDSRDVADLDAVAGGAGMRFVLGAGEPQDIDWEYLLRPLFKRLLAESGDLDMVVGDNQGTRQVLRIDGLADGLGAGPDGSLFLTLTYTPLGWQWSEVSSGVLKSPRRSPCELEPAICGEEPEVPEPPRAGPPAPRNLRIQAPWRAGVHMRAGGLTNDVDYLQLAAQTVLDLSNFALPGISDDCGTGFPGYLYGISGHVGASQFAVDYTQGVSIFCVFGVCLTPPGVLMAELIQAGADQLIQAPTVTPAFDDPTLASHEGIVIESVFDFPDGATDASHANKVTIGVWEGSRPVSIVQTATALGNCGGGCTLGTLLDAGRFDFAMRHLHLRQRCDGECPSIGMWVDSGQTVGRIDDTGRSFTSHLHFEVRARPASGAWNVANWRSVRQWFAGRGVITESDNGACIESHNRRRRHDADGDGIRDQHDNCLLVANPDQADLDRNAVGDVCDPDRDGDGIPNVQDPCPDEVAYTDFDGDGIFDSCDADADADGVPETVDRCPFFDDALDFDGDGTPDACDRDADDDGFADHCDSLFVDRCGCLNDLEPLDATSAGDHDHDGQDSLVDPCPCTNRNEICRPYEDMPAETVGLDTVHHGVSANGRGGSDVEVP